MPSTTLTRTISSVVDQRIILSKSSWVRPHGLTGWTKLRIGIRWCMRDSGAEINNPAQAGFQPLFSVGLCSGSANIFGDASVQHWVGVKTTGTSWPRIAGPPTGYQLFPTQSGKTVGTTFTLATNWLSATGYILSDVAGGNRGCWLVDITKGSPNYTIGGYARANGNAGDISLATFQTEAAIDVPTLAEHSVVNVASVAVDEGTNGTLDHVCFHWNRETPEIEISDHGVWPLA